MALGILREVFVFSGWLCDTYMVLIRSFMKGLKSEYGIVLF